jgi:two-component system, NtrC family, response regulator GlrR
MAHTGHGDGPSPLDGGLRQPSSRPCGVDRMIGTSPPFEKLRQQVMRAAQADATALVYGETGTGKELVAQAIHYQSARARKPFIPVNCGAIPAALFENELFGHRPGAFTDARSREIGLIAEAEGGTLFLDELDSLPFEVQVKLLRFLEEQCYRPLGATRALSSDVRLVVATNTDLRRRIAAGAFRSDLYYRVNLLQLTLPPLRERGEDRQALAEHFLVRYGRDPRWQLSAEAVASIESYPWPGNVRELENVIRRLVIMTSPKVVGPDDLGLPSAPEPQSVLPAESFQAACRRFERTYLEQLMTFHHGNISSAARAAMVDRASLRRMLRRHQVTYAALTDLEAEGAMP